jgi:radical SAM protein with 4Fe4S-binding SPASM domain
MMLLDAVRRSRRLRPLREAFHSARALYRKVFPRARHPPIAELRRLHAKLPYGVILEPTNACNARCVFCPVSKRGDNFEATHLDGTILDILLDEFKTWPATINGYVQMVGLGEPTVARNFAANLARLRRVVPRRYRIALNTNGTTLHSDKVTSAIIGTVDTLTISINGHDEESYKMLNGIPGFEETLQKVESFLEKKNAKGFDIPATRVQIMNTVYENPDALKRFNDRIKPRLGHRDFIHRQGLQTLAGVEEPIAALMTEEDKEREAAIKESAIPCLQVWYNAFITAEGDVYPCCIAGNVDGREERKKTGLCLGNLRDATLAELWNGDAHRELMRRHLDNEKPDFCKKCAIVTLYDETHWRTVKNHAAEVDANLHSLPVRAAKKRLPVVP